MTSHAVTLHVPSSLYEQLERRAQRAQPHPTPGTKNITPSGGSVSVRL